MPSTTNVLDEARELVQKRLAELDEERKRLERALAELAVAKRPAAPRVARVAANPARPAAAAPAAAPRKRRKRRGGTRADQAVEPDRGPARHQRFGRREDR